MTLKTALTSLLACLTIASPAIADDKIAVLELFTSQGCSSCPPADAYLRELTAQPNLITFACHVDYWDYLGWKDPYASPACSARQRVTAQVSGDRRVYTPALLINGETSVVGHHKSKIEKLVRDARPVTKIPVTYSVAEKSLSYTLPPLAEGDIVSILTIGKDASVPVARGENGGRTLNVTRPVLSVAQLVSRTGVAEVKMPISDKTAGFVILVNEKVGGAVKAAGEVRL